MKVYVYGFGEQAFSTRELAEQWQKYDEELGNDWGNQISEVEVLDRLPKVDRKWCVYSNGDVSDFYIVEGQTHHGERELYDTYEEAVAAAPARRAVWDKVQTERLADSAAAKRQESDELWERLKATGVVS
jgi:hypothetical protein